MTFIFYFAVFITIFFIMKLLLSFVGVFSDTDVPLDDFDGDGFVDVGEHISASQVDFVLFSLDSILAFLLVFSWSLLALVNQFNIHFLMSLVLALIFGAIIMLLYAYFMSKVRGLETAVVRDVYPQKDELGTMYLSIKNGTGKAKFIIDKKQYILDVRSEDLLQTKDIVKVVAVDQSIIYVEKYQKKEE